MLPSHSPSYFRSHGSQRNSHIPGEKGSITPIFKFRRKEDTGSYWKTSEPHRSFTTGKLSLPIWWLSVMEWLQWSAREDWPVSSIWNSVRPLVKPGFEGCRTQWMDAARELWSMVPCLARGWWWEVSLRAVSWDWGSSVPSEVTRTGRAWPLSTGFQVTPSCRYSDTPKGWG